MSLFVTQSDLLRAVRTAGEIALKGPTDPQRWIRLFISPDRKSVSVMACAGGMSTCRTVSLKSQPDAAETLDVCVPGERLVAGSRALREGDVKIGLEEGALKVEQDGGVSIELELCNLVEFPGVPDFSKMKQVYVGPNPAPGFEAIKHVALTNPGTTPLSAVLIMMNGRSYISSPTSSVRCDFSLIGVDEVGPVPVVLESTWVLTHFAEQVTCWHETNRILIIDKDGWATIALWAGQLAGFPTKIESTFASLKQVAQIKAPRAEVLRAASAAQVVLKGTTKEAVFLWIETSPEKERITVSAKIGRHAYKETLVGWSSHQMKVPVHVGRFAEFLRGSDDEAVYVKLMNSELVPNAQKKFVHFVDSRLHEVVGLPGEYVAEIKETT